MSCQQLFISCPLNYLQTWSYWLLSLRFRLQIDIMRCVVVANLLKMDLSFVAFQLADVFDINYLSHTASNINIPTHLQISNNKMLLLITQ